jgi:predicted CopG family antitoxin
MSMDLFNIIKSKVKGRLNSDTIFTQDDLVNSVYLDCVMKEWDEEDINNSIIHHSIRRYRNKGNPVGSDVIRKFYEDRKEDQELFYEDGEKDNTKAEIWAILRKEMMKRVKTKIEALL